MGAGVGAGALVVSAGVVTTPGAAARGGAIHGVLPRARRGGSRAQASPVSLAVVVAVCLCFVIGGERYLLRS